MVRRRRLGLTLAAGSACLLLACSPDEPEIRVEGPPTTGTVASSDGAASPEPGPAAGVVGADPVDSDASPAEPATGPAGPSELVGHHVPVVVDEYPHDANAFTQGLEWYRGELLESTGLVGRSSLRLVDPETGTPRVVAASPEELFAEGITVVDGEAVQLTYQDRVLLRTPLPDGPTTRIDDAYDGEGWGLCFDGAHLVMSDGSDELEFRDPETFSVTRTIEVSLGDRRIEDLNELECVGGQILANVWQTNTIVVIDATTGEVEGTIDATNLVPAEHRDSTNAVLNGIAYNPTTDTYWLTGKLWPVIYEVTFDPA